MAEELKAEVRTPCSPCHGADCYWCKLAGRNDKADDRVDGGADEGLAEGERES